MDKPPICRFFFLLGVRNKHCIAVAVLTRRIHICQKKLYVLFWMSYTMFVEAAFLDELLRHIFWLNFYLGDLVCFSYSDFFSAWHEEFSFSFSMVSADPPGVSADPSNLFLNVWTCFLVCIHDKNKISFFWELSYCTNNMTRQFWNLACEKLFREKTIQKENDSDYMIFLAYRYVCYIKTQCYFILQSYYYDIIYGNKKNKKRRTSPKRKLNFRLRDVLRFLIWCLKVEIPK